MNTRTGPVGLKNTRANKTRDTKNKATMTDTVTGSDEGKTENMGTAIGAALIRINEINQEMRQQDKKNTDESLKLLSDKLEALQLAHIKSIESQKLSIKTPLPKYNGKAGEFDDWKNSLLTCIKNNDWHNEGRILEMLPGALTGQASIAFASIPEAQKTTLDSVFLALKQALEPTCKAHNRALFLKAKRTPGESMRAFVGRCNQYVRRADEIDDASKSLWANSFIVEKIYANLTPLDRKILKNGAGDSEDVQLLATKADDLLAGSEDIVGSINQDTSSKFNHPSNQTPRKEPQWNFQQPWRGQLLPPNRGHYHNQYWGDHNWQNQNNWRQPHHSTQKSRPGGGWTTQPRKRPNQEKPQGSSNGLNSRSPLQKGL